MAGLLPDGVNTVPSITALASNAVSTSDSYRMKIADERISGSVAEVDAIAQACYKVLNTERYAYPIYSWNYGVELQDLFGKPIPYVYAVLPGRIKEALIQDDRIDDVTDFQLSHDGGDVTCKFIVHSVFGEVELSKEVTIF